MRRLVLATGVILGLAGCLVAATMPLGAGWRLGLVTAWGAFVGRELRVLCRAWRACRAVRISADGGVAVLGEDGGWQPARLVSGSMLLSRLGWLRIQAAGGPVFAELARGNRRTDRDWRRLHVIWRHFGAAR